MSTQHKGAARPTPFARVQPDIAAGLTAQQVSERVSAGAVNRQEEGLTPTVGGIIFKNTFTLFNFILLALAVVIILVGHIEQTLFLGIALSNTVMGIIQELRAKKTLDKLSILAQAKATVVREGVTGAIEHDRIVLDDIVYLTSGDQVCADAAVLESNGLEVDESLLTGETNRIYKAEGDQVLSGSYITGGQAYVYVTAVGQDNYANALTAEAKKDKKSRSKLLDTLNAIIKALTIVIIPLGILLFCSKYFGWNGDGIELAQAILGAASSMTGMIPGGLVLLTGVTLTVGALSLARHKALVQSLPSIETLARVDVLCLDKTGTITDGSLAFEEMIVLGGAQKPQLDQAISELMGTLKDTNATAICLRDTFGQSNRWIRVHGVPFSSDRKWSGATFGESGSYILGAPNIIFGGSGAPFLAQANAYAAKGFRVLCLAHSTQPIVENALPGDLVCQALMLLSDNIREDAAETFRYFIEEGVRLKVISGDNPRTVGAVAAKAGLPDADAAIDMSTVDDSADFGFLSEAYTVFGHVSPQQKRALVRAMQKNGHTVCMTGDGVNDILAMREADCGVAMVGGSEAARSACDFVLMSSNFSAMINVLKEGRRVINNIERVASLFLVNTIYSAVLTLIYIFLPFPYPYAPLQVSATSWLTVGLPSFFLAMRVNYDRPAGKFGANVFDHAFPAALTVVFNTVYLQLAGHFFDLPWEHTSTMTVLLIGVVGFCLLFRIAKPYNLPIKLMLVGLVTAFVLLYVFFGGIFSLEGLFTRNVFFYLPLMIISFHLLAFLGKTCRRLREFFTRQGKRSDEALASVK